MSPAYFERLSVRIGSRLARSSRSSASGGAYGMASIMVPGAEKRHWLIWFWSEDLIVMDAGRNRGSRRRRRMFRMICLKFRRDLNTVLVEKDVRRNNIADVKPFRLVFSGGTALNRAHRLIRRMSEDIDLKIVSDQPRSRPELRKLRDIVTGALLQDGFQFDPENAAHRESANASR
jgi:nucleotidyltransferase AbiEii toxin of type IV toxin-antitoxin system